MNRSMPTKSTILGFLTLGLLVAVPVLLITLHAPRSTVHAAALAPAEHMTFCFDEQTCQEIARAFLAGKIATEPHRGCGLGLIQVHLKLDTARELLGSIVATLNARDQAIEREKIREEREHSRH